MGRFISGPNPTAMRNVTEIEKHAERSETTVVVQFSDTGPLPKPQGEQALSNAERQALYRTRHAQQPPKVVIRTRRPVDRRSRLQRWDDATNVLLAIQGECVDWLEALPESLRSTAMAEALEAIADLDLTALAEVKPPRGYGRD